ncbi:LPS export ABC transporter permease LptG [Thiomicrorhabdus immobilis]|uniref:LPS export ABC transporter permease LptG n=1 Tax=Thiomicrorhabdus immobilis TaxID=2791037 RepID=A0ABM7MBJ9_9GAMM|nr:LPS export ABC transporter permease LptG [Thiomicrorhabdus immobilis]BCN92719.1 LPS export ABC transporter permease LptG [Thiomicrorhabdus immobilis]
MNRIERYLGGVVLGHSLLVMLVLMVIFSFFEFMNQVGKLTEGYTLGLASFYTLLKVPVYSYEVFPIVLLIGTLMGLGSLANQSELTVLRVTGWSIKRILWAVLKTAFLMWLVMAVIGEFIAPKSEAYAKNMRAEALNQSFSIGSNSGLWVKDEYRYIHVGRIISSQDLRDIEVYDLDQGRIKGLIQAKQAHYVNDSWVFKEVKQVDLTLLPADQQLPARIEYSSKNLQKMAEIFPLKPEDLTKLDIETRYLSGWDLYHYVAFLEDNGLDASSYLLSLWRKIATPIVVLAMIAVVFPLIFGSMRQVSVGQRIFLGVLIGMGFHLINQLIGNISVVYQLPIVLGALGPSIALLLFSWYWLRKVDG